MNSALGFAQHCHDLRLDKAGLLHRNQLGKRYNKILRLRPDILGRITEGVLKNDHASMPDYAANHLDHFVCASDKLRDQVRSTIRSLATGYDELSIGRCGLLIIVVSLGAPLSRSA